LKIDELVDEILESITRFTAFKKCHIVDRTENIIKIFVTIDDDLFIHDYFNERKNKLNLAFIQNNQRIYGIDSEGGFLHIHPFQDPNQHISIGEMISLEDFFYEVQQYCEKKNLL
jgi:hypothetical protein